MVFQKKLPVASHSSAANNQLLTLGNEIRTNRLEEKGHQILRAEEHTSFFFFFYPTDVVPAEITSVGKIVTDKRFIKPVKYN